MREVDEAYRKYIAEQLADSGEKIADLWLSELDKIIDEPTREIFPTDLLLDHIPSLIHEIASVIAKPEDELAVTSSLITRKAHDLGKLRHSQNATVHQLLREYDLLASILEDFVATESERYEKEVDYRDCIKLMAGIAHIIRTILQATVDSFIEIYMETIEDQTKRLVSFNDFVSHELKRPLQAALLNSELLLEGKTIDEEQTQELLAVKNSIQQAATLLKDVSELTDSAPKSNTSPVDAEIDIEILVKDILTQTKDMLDEHDVKVEIENELGSVVSNLAKVDLILTNLITNAAKYSDPAKDQRHIKLKRLDGDANTYILRISDNGVGIEQADQESIFNLHVRAHENSEEKGDVGGHGIGLFLVREAIEKLQGDLQMTSQVSKGTSFTIKLPQGESSITN